MIDFDRFNNRTCSFRCSLVTLSLTRRSSWVSSTWGVWNKGGCSISKSWESETEISDACRYQVRTSSTKLLQYQPKSNDWAYFLLSKKTVSKCT